MRTIPTLGLALALTALSSSAAELSRISAFEDKNPGFIAAVCTMHFDYATGLALRKPGLSAKQRLDIAERFLVMREVWRDAVKRVGYSLEDDKAVDAYLKTPSEYRPRDVNDYCAGRANVLWQVSSDSTRKAQVDRARVELVRMQLNLDQDSR